MTKRFLRKLSILLIAAVLVTSCHLSTLAIDETEMVALSQQEAEQEGMSGTEGTQAAPAGDVTAANNSAAEAEAAQNSSVNDGTEPVVVAETGAQNAEESSSQAATEEAGGSVVKDIVNNIVDSITNIISGGNTEIDVTDNAGTDAAGNNSPAEAGPGAENIIKIDTETAGEQAADENAAEQASPSELPPMELVSEPVDGVIVTVTAPEGTFPADAKLVVNKVAADDNDIEDIEAAVDNAKLVEAAQGENTEDADSKKDRYTFDIKVEDAQGKEIQPANEISVKFALADSEKPIADANVYHLEENNEVKAAAQAAVLDVALSGNGSLDNAASAELDDYADLDGDLENDLGTAASKQTAKAADAEASEDATVELKESSLIALPLETTVNEETVQEVEAVTGGFSYYVVEFFYKEYKYVLAGDAEVELSAILDALEIKVDASTVTKVETSNPELFYATKSQATDSEASDSVWVVKSLKPFTTDEWMKVYVGDVCYEVKVTDAYGPVDIYYKDGTLKETCNTLEEAFNKVDSNQTIKLRQNVERTYGKRVYSCEFHSGKKNVKLDLNNFSLSYVEIDVQNGSTLVVVNENATSYSNVSFFASGSETDITINSGLFYNSISDLCALEARNGATIQVKGGSIGNGEENSQIMAIGGKIYIGGNTIVNVGKDIFTSQYGGQDSVIVLDSTNDIRTAASVTAHSGKIIINSNVSSTNTINIDAGAELNVQGGSVTGSILNNGTLNVNGGTIINHVNSYGKMEICPTKKAVTISSPITFSGNNSVATLSSADNSQLQCNGKMVLSGGPTVVVDGGTYTRNSGYNFEVGSAAKLIINGGKINNDGDGAFAQQIDKDIVLNGGQYSVYEPTLSLVAFIRGQAVKTVFDGGKKVYEVVDQAEVGNRRCSLAQAFDYAKISGDKVVTLLGSIDKLFDDDITGFTVTVPSSITLDLAGNTLQCESFSSVNAIVKDSSSPIIEERGLLKTGVSDNPVHPELDPLNGGYMPLYTVYKDSKGQDITGYRFFKYSMDNRRAYQLASSSNVSCFPLVLQFGDEGQKFNYQAKAYEMIKSSNDECGLKLYSIVKLTKKNGNTKYYKFQYSTSDIRVLKGYMDSQYGQSSLKRLSVFYKVPNCQADDEVEATFYVESSQTKFIASSQTQSWKYK